MYAGASILQRMCWLSAIVLAACGGDAIDERGSGAGGSAFGGSAGMGGSPVAGGAGGSFATSSGVVMAGMPNQLPQAPAPD